MAPPSQARRSEMSKLLMVLLLMVELEQATAQATGPTSADAAHTHFAGIPQLVFSPQPSFSAAADLRRKLSLQQQTQILTDIQQHHQRFFQQPQPQQQQQLPRPPSLQPPSQQPPSQSLFHSQQTDVGATAASSIRETEPIYQPQPGQFVRFHTSAGALPAPPPPLSEVEATQPARAQLHQFSAHQPLVRSQNLLLGNQHHVPQLPTAAGAVTLQNKLHGSATNASPARGRSEDSFVTNQQLYLPDERQKLFEQIKDYNEQQKQQQQTAPAFPVEHRETGSGPSTETPLPPPSDINDNPLKAQETRVKPQVNHLRQQQLQQQLQAQLQKQFQLQLLQRQELIRQLKQALANTPAPTHRDQILPHPSASGTTLGNATSPLFLANGQQLKIFENSQEHAPVASNTVSVRSTSPFPPTPSTPATPAAPPAARPSATSTSVKAPKALFDELTKGVLPPGAEFDVIRHKQDGGLEEVSKLPSNLPDKKVTFVFLEEQPDGSVKIQGVRGNNAEPTANKTSSPEDIDSIIKKIQEGDLKLPPTTKLQSTPTGVPGVETTVQETVYSPTFSTKTTSERSVPPSIPNGLLPTVSPKATDFLPKLIDNTVSLPKPSDMEFFPSVAITSSEELASTPNPYFEINDFQAATTSSPLPHTAHPLPSTNKQSTYSNVESLFISSSSQPAYNNRNTIPGNSADISQFGKSPQDTPRLAVPPVNRPTSPPRPSTSAPPSPSPSGLPRVHFSPTPVTTVPPSVVIVNSPSTGSPLFTPRPTSRPTPRTSSVTPTPTPIKSSEGSRVSFPGSEAASSNGSATLVDPAPAGVLTQVLKKEGLFAMAKFLKDSGLDSILNDTGPYTIFIPTDKAFRALLVQLGGPEKAEVKFRENPRLLSGLLLHHVIPGAFHLNDLQDEMTGVSLAGTQLRVNTYHTQDTQWNDVQVTTINGARIVRGLHDIAVPQGVAHALDRVMFPLPVGDLLQTLAADRERRFTRLLRLVRAAGMEGLLSGARTHTLLAPTDKALGALPGGELQRALKDAGRARALVQRHLLTGALYGAGLRFYQEKPTLAAGRPVALAKADGQLKANSAHVLTPNIPATNGVLHVIDTAL